MPPAAPPAVTPTARQRRKEARPAELLAAALDLFVEKGFAATRMDEIAARAGVSKGTVFLYFESKQALFRAVVENVLMPYITAGEARVEEASGESHEALLREVLQRFREVLSDERMAALTRLIGAEAGNFPEQAAYYRDNILIRARNLLVGVLDRGVAAGVFRPCDTILVARLALAPMMFDCTWSGLFQMCETRSIASDELVGTHMDIFIRGLLVNPSAQEER